MQFLFKFVHIRGFNECNHHHIVWQHHIEFTEALHRFAAASDFEIAHLRIDQVDVSMPLAVSNGMQMCWVAFAANGFCGCSRAIAMTDDVRCCQSAVNAETVNSAAIRELILKLSFKCARGAFAVGSIPAE